MYTTSTIICFIYYIINNVNYFVISLDVNDMSKDITIECNNKEISVTIDTKSKSFTGIIYPKGLSKNSSCMAEFNYEKSPVVYKLPLRSCNTMSTYLVRTFTLYYFNCIKFYNYNFRMMVWLNTSIQ